MSVPNFLNTSHRYLQTAAVVDVNTIISDFRSETVTNGNPAWTEPTTALFKSPVDAAGRWFDVLLTRIDATTLECRTRDQNGNTIVTRRAYIDAAGTDVRYFTGEAHYCVECRRASPETLRGGLIDLSPEGQTTHSYVVWASGHRTNTGTANDYINYLATMGEAGIANRVMYLSLFCPTVSGAFLYAPLFITNVNSQYCGRAYQFYLCDDYLGNGVEITVPIDTGVTAKFRVLGVPIAGNQKLCVRAD